MICLHCSSVRDLYLCSPSDVCSVKVLEVCFLPHFACHMGGCHLLQQFYSLHLAKFTQIIRIWRNYLTGRLIFIKCLWSIPNCFKQIQCVKNILTRCGQGVLCQWSALSQLSRLYGQQHLLSTV